MAEYREVLAEVLPEVRPMFDFDQKNPHHYLDVWSHTLKALAVTTKRRSALLPELPTMDDTVKGFDITSWQGYLGPANMPQDIVVKLNAEIRDADVFPEGKSVKRWLNRLGVEGLRQLLMVKAADRSATNYKFENLSVLSLVEKKIDTVIQEGQCFTREKLQINGNDLLALGVPEGKQIGEILDELLNLVIEERLPNQRTVLLNRAKQMMKEL